MNFLYAVVYVQEHNDVIKTLKKKWKNGNGLETLYTHLHVNIYTQYDVAPPPPPIHYPMNCRFVGVTFNKNQFKKCFLYIIS